MIKNSYNKLVESNMSSNKGKVYDIYMDSNYGATGTQRHFTNPIKHYTKPIMSSNGRNYIDENSHYTGLYSLPEDSALHGLKMKGLETAVCVCVYNEGKVPLEATLTGIYNNLDLMKAKRERGEKEMVAVFVIQDGIMKADKTIQTFLQPFEPVQYKSQIKMRQSLILYEKNIVQMNKHEINPSPGDDIPCSIPKKTSLVYEIQWKPQQGARHYSLKVFMVFKHSNGKKLSSHAWFFEGFCRYLNPKFCVLLDVGTVPQDDGMANLILALKSDDKIGGVSGFMNIDANLASSEDERPVIVKKDGVNYTQLQDNSQHNIKLNPLPAQKTIQPREIPPNCCQKAFFSIQKAQASQYIMAHFLDKNFESSLGFLHVLPGAWSGYRLEALQTGQIYERDILQKKYFRTLINPNQNLQAYQMMKTSNMYLAEDRILSLAIYCQKNKQYYLKYVPNAKAKTDPMKNQVDLSLQRRRWINSSLYAFEYVLANYEYDMANSSHSAWDQIKMHFNITMSAISFFNSSLIPCFFLFVLFSTIYKNGFIPTLNDDLSNQNTVETAKLISFIIGAVVSFIYILVVFYAILGSMNGNIWIREIYERDSDGNVKMEEVNGKKQPIKLKGQNKVNGKAHNITVILAIYNVLWFIVVSMFTVILVIDGVKSLINTRTIQATPAIAILFLIINIGCYLLLLLVHLPTHYAQVWQLFIGSVSSLYYLSLYTHTMVIFSMCNVDDTSWGTKGATSKEQNSSGFQKQKSYFVGWWIMKNAIVCFILFMIDINVPNGGYVTIALACYSSVLYSIKCIIAICNQFVFLIKHYCCCCLKKL